MQYWKIGRLFSLVNSMIYNLVFVGMAVDLLLMMEVLDHKNYEIGELM